MNEARQDHDVPSALTAIERGGGEGGRRDRGMTAARSRLRYAIDDVTGAREGVRTV